MYTEKDVRNLLKLERQYEKLKQKANLIEKERIRLFIKVTHIKSITEFYEKVPLFISEPWDSDCTSSFVITTVPENHLRADIYHNAHVSRYMNRWGLRVYDFSSSDVFKDKFLGAHFQKDEAVKIAKDWVIGKGLPEGIK